MKYFLSIFLITLFFQTFSQVTEKELIVVAENFIDSDDFFQNYSVNKKKNVQELQYENLIVGYVVSLAPQGFVIFSSSKDIYPVFGYSTENDFDFFTDQIISIDNL